MGKCAFEYIKDYEEWIQSGHFTEDIVCQLRGRTHKEIEQFNFVCCFSGFKLRQGKHLVNSVFSLLNATKQQTSF